jgi:endoglucanase Acf2
VTGNDTVRDLGAYLYTTEMVTIEQYWFDVDEIVFPEAYEHNCVGMVWGTKATHESWFRPNRR